VFPFPVWMLQSYVYVNVDDQRTENNDVGSKRAKALSTSPAVQGEVKIFAHGLLVQYQAKR